MKFNSKTFGVLLAIAALSFTACTTEVRTVEVPVTASEADEAVVDATEPATTAVPFTLPIATTTQATVPPTTQAPATFPPVVEDANNDWILDNIEYSVWASILEDDGYGYLIEDQATVEEFGVTLCTLATVSVNSDEYYGAILDAIEGIYTTDEAAEVTAITYVMCQSEMDRLNG